MHKLPKSAVLVAAVLTLLFARQAPAGAKASVKVTGAPFSIRYGVETSTRFTISGDGKITVTSRATGGGLYFVQVRRENCSLGCHGYKLVGDRKQLTADGVTRTFTLSPGNSTRINQLWISKPDDGRLIKGTISFQ